MTECDNLRFESLTVKQLQHYLRSKGQPQSGRKEDLIRRACGTHALEFQKNHASSEALLRIQNQSETTEGEATDRDHQHAEIQRVADFQNWQNVDDVPMSDWPEVTDGELFDYMVYTCSKTYDQQGKKARRQLKADVFYKDGHVHSVKYHPAPDAECYVSCLVIPSAASSDTVKYPDRKAWVRLSKVTGRVITAYCTCVAGIGGSCNHVAALLYALIDISHQKKEGLDASTSSACKWRQPRKRRMSPKKSSDFQLKLNRKEVHRNNTPTSETAGPPLQTVDVEAFALTLARCAPRAGWLANFTASKEPAPEKHYPAMPEAMYMYRDGINIESEMCQIIFNKYLSDLSITELECLDVELQTRLQVKSEVWFKMRAGRLTSSHFGDICKQRETTKPDCLLKDIMGYRAGIETEHTKWGRGHEAAARRCYETAMKKTHPGLCVKRIGLVISQKLPFLASSPDGLVTCHHCSPTQGLLEIKCPSKHRFVTPEEACADRQFCCELVNEQVNLKKSHKFYSQIQGQMGVCGKKWCDFFIWTLKGHAVQRIQFDEDHWTSMVETLRRFYVKAVVPEIFTSRVKRGKSLY